MASTTTRHRQGKTKPRTNRQVPILAFASRLSLGFLINVLCVTGTASAQQIAGSTVFPPSYGNYANHVSYGRQFQTSQPSFASPRPAAPLSNHVSNSLATTNHERQISHPSHAIATPSMIYPTEFESSHHTFGTAAPNVIIHVTAGQLLQRLEQTQVTRDPIYAVILGTSLQGNAMTQTTVRPELLPSERGIEVALHLHTRAFTNATGTASAATAHNRGVTEITGHKQILFTPSQFLTTNGNTTANTQSDIVGFKWDRRFGERIARDRAAQQKPIAEQITAQKAADQARTQFDKQVDRQVARFEAQYREGLRTQLATLPRQPDDVRFRSTQNTVVIETIFGSGATGSPPPSLRMNGRCQGMAVQMHQSVIADALSRLNDALAGQSLDEKDWSERLANLLPAPAESLKVSNNRRQWTLGMAKERPLQVTLGNDGLQVALKIDSFKVGKTKYPGMLIETAYTPTIKDGKIVAVRDEKLRLTPLDENGDAKKPQAEKTGKPKDSSNSENADAPKKKTPKDTKNEAPKKEDQADAKNEPAKKVSVRERLARKGSSTSKRRLGLRQQIFRSMVRKRFDPIFGKEIALGEQQQTLAGSSVVITRIELNDDWATIQAVSQ